MIIGVKMSIRHNRDLRYQKSRNKTTTRPKSFSSEDSAKKYADENGIKKYTLKKIRTGNKLRNIRDAKNNKYIFQKR